jgi:erythromycin esterase-like protein
MTRRLIEERGFCAVAAEADRPDAYRVNRYVRGRSEDATAEEALRGFERFPTWMWRNAAVLDFVGWLRGHNDRAMFSGRVSSWNLRVSAGLAGRVIVETARQTHAQLVVLAPGRGWP